MEYKLNIIITSLVIHSFIHSAIPLFVYNMKNNYFH